MLNEKNINKNRIEFVHPSYLDAFRSSLSTHGTTTKVGQILGRVLEYLTNTTYI